MDIKNGGIGKDFILAIFFCAVFSNAACSETAPDLNRFVLANDEIPGFAIVKEPAYYNPGTLWNYINGGALPYLDYGVGDVVTYSGTVGSDGFEIVVDIYDMADSLGAFGIYSSERFPEYTYPDIGVEGYVTEDALSFWKDRYYVKVFSNESSTPSITPIEQIARAVDRRIPDGGGMPEYFSLFPPKGRLEKTESYLAKNVLGQDFLANAFVVTYRTDDDQEYQLYLLSASNPDEAGEKLRKYREFIGEYGTLEKKKRIGLGEEEFVGNEAWYGLMLFVRAGAVTLGSVGCSDFDLARSQLDYMISGLNR